jgi:hypothetical protein
MPEWRLPPVYLLYVLLSILQPIVFLAFGALKHLSMTGTILVVLLLIALGFGSRIAWGILIILDAIPVVAAFVAIGGHTLWGSFALTLITAFVLEAVLFSAEMRRQVRGGRPAASGADLTSARGSRKAA